MRQASAFIAFLGLVMVGTSGMASDESLVPVAEGEVQRVLAAEDQYVAAEVSRDEPALLDLVDDKFVFNSSDGTTSGKAELIRGVMSMDMVGQELSERSVLIEGDVAVIYGTTELRFQSPGEALRISKYRYTSVYVNREGAWRMLGLQMQKHSSQ